MINMSLELVGVNDKLELLEYLLTDESVCTRLENALTYYIRVCPAITSKSGGIFANCCTLSFSQLSNYGRLIHYDTNYNITEEREEIDDSNNTIYDTYSIGSIPLHIMCSKNYKQLIDKLVEKEFS